MDFTVIGNRVILGFSNVYDESEDEDTLIEQVYNAKPGQQYRSGYGNNNGHPLELMRGSLEITAERRGFSFEEVLSAALIKSGVKDYTVQVTTDDGQTDVSLNFDDNMYVEDLYFELIGNEGEEKEYKVTITDPQGNESWRLIRATKREITV